MNRLTYKLDEPIKTKYLNYEYNRIKDYDIDRCNFGRITDDMIFNKLGKLEDIEEEIGIDLITLFKALKKGIFVAYDSSFGMANKPKIKIAKDTATGICYRNKKWYIQEDETLIKDYGKTWSLDKKILTKEVLENDKQD